MTDDMDTADSKWEPLDCARMWAVVDVEQPYSCTPLAMFQQESEANDWIAWSRTALDLDGEHIYSNADYYQALPVRSLTGEFWNSFDPLPTEAP